MPTNSKSIIKKYAKYITGLRVARVAIIILCLVAICTLINPPLRKVADTYSGLAEKTPELTDGIKFSQAFTADRDYDFFGIFFSNYLNFFREGKIFITVKNDQSSEQFTYDARNLLNESYLYIHHPLAAGQQYSLEIQAENIPKEKVFTFTTIKSADKTLPPLVVNGKKRDGTLLMTFVYRKKDYFPIWYCLLGITLLSIYITLFTKKEQDVKNK